MIRTHPRLPQLFYTLTMTLGETSPLLFVAGKVCSSLCETYANSSVRTRIDILISALNETRAEMTIHFKSPSDSLFPTPPPHVGTTFTIRDHPTKSECLTLFTREPGQGFTLISAPLTVSLADKKYSEGYVPTAYEALIYDAVRGDHTWFIPRQEAEQTWKIWDAAIRHTEGTMPVKYEYGSEGPKEEKELLRRLGVEFGTGVGYKIDASKVIGTERHQGEGMMEKEQ